MNADTKVASAAPASGSGTPKLTTKPPCEPMQGRGRDLAVAASSICRWLRLLRSSASVAVSWSTTSAGGEATGGEAHRPAAGVGRQRVSRFPRAATDRCTPCRTLSPKDPAVPHDPLEEGLEAEPTRDMRPDLRTGEFCTLVCDVDGLAGCRGEKLGWQERSMVMNHHGCLVTEWPTVSRPWLRKMTALRSPSAWAMRFPSSYRAPPRGSRRTAHGPRRRRRRLGDGFEQSAHGRPGLAVDRMGVGGGDHVGPGAWTCEWMAKAAVLTGWSPSTTSPRWFTQMSEETLTWPKCMRRGSPRSGRRARGPGGDVAATPSSKPHLEKRRKAAASRCLR